MSDDGPDYVRLADEIERDIRSRRLKRGERYPSTPEIAKRLGAATSTVNRALQLLVRRGVVTRKQRSGTVVDLSAPPSPGIGAIHIVVAKEAVESEGLFRDGTLLGLQEAVPSARLHFDFTPPDEDPEAAARFIETLIGGTERDSAFVLVRSSLALQRAVAASGLPAVISGSRYASVKGLPSVNRDNAAIGRLLARHMLGLRRRRLLVLLRARHMPGDDALLDALRGELDAAGLGAGSLITRSLPTDPDVVRAEVRALLDGPRPPNGVVCRNVPMALAARALKRDVELAVCDYFPHAEGPAPGCVYTRPTLSPEDIGRRLGQALLKPDVPSFDIPMELVES